MDDLITKTADWVRQNTTQHIPIAVNAADLQPDHPCLIAIPDGFTIHDVAKLMQPYRERPRRITDVARLDTPGAFIDYANRFKTPDTALFVDFYSGTWAIEIVVDYHAKRANKEAAKPAAADYQHHRAIYVPRLHPTLVEWSGVFNGPLEQAEFAQFLEFRLNDVSNPPVDWMAVDPRMTLRVCAALNLRDDPTPDGHVDGETYDLRTAEDMPSPGEEDPYDDIDTMYVPLSALHKLRRLRFGTQRRLQQMTRDLAVTKNQQAKIEYHPKTGDRVVEFSEESEARDKRGRKVVIPDLFLLHFPLFESAQHQYLPIRLYVRGTKAPKFYLFPVDLKMLMQSAVEDEAKDIQQATDLPLFYGRPDITSAGATELRNKTLPLRTVDLRRAIKGE